LERESDLEIAFESSSGEILFIIENKINAQFQPNQAEDYKNRGIEYVRRGKCSEFYTVLFAPKDYIRAIEQNHKFHYYLSFEKVIEFFFTQNQLGNRAKYKIEVLTRAIEKYGYRRQISNSSKKTYQPSDVNHGITSFWEHYWEDLSERIPELYMPRPGIKGPASTFIGLAKSVLPPKVIIYHKFVHGYVDLQFDSLGNNAESLINVFRNYIEVGMSIQKVGKSAVVVRIEVPKINPHMFYDAIQEDVHKGQDSAEVLLKWFYKNRNLWASFRE
jgi:hypothetical protein